MPDTFSVTTSQSWFSRLGKAIGGVIVGFLLVLAAFPLLWWNEGRAVHRARSLEEGATVVASVAADRLDPGHEGRLVHMTALASTDETLTDPEFGISAGALRLIRTAETYQWKETEKTETRSQLGGGEKTTKTYHYEKDWSERHHDSSRFHRPAGHENPATLRWTSTSVAAGQVLFGGFTLPPALVDKIGDHEARPVQAGDEQLMAALGFRREGDTFYNGRNSAAPQVGDVRVRFEVTPPQTVSIVAQQRGQSFEAYPAKAGSTILLLTRGSVPAEQMFKSAQTSNTILTWVLRAAFFLLMFIGLMIVFRPLSVAGSVIPILGKLVGAGTGLVAFLLAAIFSLTTIAMAWLFYRPLLGASLLAAAAAGVYWLARSRKKAPAVVPPPIPQV